MNYKEGIANKWDKRRLRVEQIWRQGIIKSTFWVMLSWKCLLAIEVEMSSRQLPISGVLEKNLGWRDNFRVSWPIDYYFQIKYRHLMIFEFQINNK